MTEALLRYFLLVFDPSNGRSAEVRTFEETDDALDAYRDTEHRFRGQQGIQVVLIGADSLETVKKTHSNYFGDESLRAMSKRIHAAL